MAESRGVDVIAVNAPLLALAWIACALRCYARIGLLKNFGLDDLFSVLALVRILALYVIAVLKEHLLSLLSLHLHASVLQTFIMASVNIWLS